MDRKLLESAGPSGASTRGLIPSARDADDVDAVSGTESSEDDSEDDMEALQAELEKLKCDTLFASLWLLSVAYATALAQSMYQESM
jgi:hypothetical protein